MKNLFHKFKKFLSKPGMFSRILVIFCIAYCVRIVEWGIDQFEISNTEAATLITSGLALFGGELLLLCIKRTFAKNDNKKIAEVDDEIHGVTSHGYSDSNESFEEPEEFVAG